MKERKGFRRRIAALWCLLKYSVGVYPPRCMRSYWLPNTVWHRYLSWLSKCKNNWSRRTTSLGYSEVPKSCTIGNMWANKKIWCAWRQWCLWNRAKRNRNTIWKVKSTKEEASDEEHGLCWTPYTHPRWADKRGKKCYCLNRKNASGLYS